jgi:hypothetical protein
MNSSNRLDRESAPHASVTRAQRLAALVFLSISIGLLAISAISVFYLWKGIWPISKWTHFRFFEVLASTVLAIPIGIFAVRKSINAFTNPPSYSANNFLTKTWVILFVSAWISYLFVTNRFSGTTFLILWGCFSLPMNAALLFRDQLGTFFQKHRVIWASWALLFNLAFGLIAVEVGLHVTRHFSNSIVFLDDETKAEDYIAKQRLKPGRIMFDTVVDHRGFSDEFKERKKGDTLVASIGGSFNVIGTPLRYHFTSIAEQRTSNLQVYCMGVSGIGLNHYPALIRKDVVPLHPDGIVLTLFVSGLLPQIEKKEFKHPILRDWFSRERCMILTTLPKIVRLFQLQMEKDRSSALAKETGIKKRSLKASSELPSLRTILKYNPWLINPLLEKPWMEEKAFLELETERAINSCMIGQSSYQWLRPLLKEVKKSAGDIPVFALVIPDEFQVEDSLWEQVKVGIPDWVKYRRFYPQERIHAELKDLGIPFVDCLKALRRGPRYKDGKTHYYLNRNTHLNTRGNRVVGKLLSKLLQEQLHLKPKKKHKRKRTSITK